MHYGPNQKYRSLSFFFTMIAHSLTCGGEHFVPHINLANKSIIPNWPTRNTENTETREFYSRFFETAFASATKQVINIIDTVDNRLPVSKVASALAKTLKILCGSRKHNDKSKTPSNRTPKNRVLHAPIRDLHLLDHKRPGENGISSDLG